MIVFVCTYCFHVVLFSSTTVATSGAGTAYPFGISEFIPVCFYIVRVAQKVVFCVVFYRSWFVFFPFSFGHCVFTVLT